MRLTTLTSLAALGAASLLPLRGATSQTEFHWTSRIAVGKAIELVAANTVNGSIRISTSGYAEAETVNGSIVASLGRATWSDGIEFRTVNGGITLDLPATLSTEVRAETVNGDILTDFPLTVTGRLGPRRISGTIGTGGRQLALATVNGSIRLRKTT